MSNIIKYFVLIAFSNPLLADDFFEWTTTNIQFLHGSGFELGSNKRSLFRIEHTNSWRYGKNFTFVDVTQRDDFGTELYGEWYSGLSLNKLTNEDFSIGIIRDFSFLAGINAGNDPKDDPFKAYLLGVEMSFAVPGDGFFNLGVLARKSDDVRTVGIQITPSWSVPFHIGELKLEFSGFFDLVDGRSSGGKTYLLAKPQLLLDIGNVFAVPGKIFAGIEYAYWRNKFGLKGVTEQSIQGMIKIYF